MSNPGDDTMRPYRIPTLRVLDDKTQMLQTMHSSQQDWFCAYYIGIMLSTMMESAAQGTGKDLKPPTSAISKVLQQSPGSGGAIGFLNNHRHKNLLEVAPKNFAEGLLCRQTASASASLIGTVEWINV